MADLSEGGTKIKRNPQQMQQQQGMQQQDDPRIQQQMQQQMQQQQMQQKMQQQQGRQSPIAQQMQQPVDPTMLEQLKSNFQLKSALKKSSFGSISTPILKTSIIVSVLFLLLNSKIIWKQIIRLPMMGTTDPSILALIVNSILAGIFFYIISSLQN